MGIDGPGLVEVSLLVPALDPKVRDSLSKYNPGPCPLSPSLSRGGSGSCMVCLLCFFLCLLTTSLLLLCLSSIPTHYYYFLPLQCSPLGLGGKLAFPPMQGSCHFCFTPNWSALPSVKLSSQSEQVFCQVGVKSTITTITCVSTVLLAVGSI